MKLMSIRLCNFRNNFTGKHQKLSQRGESVILTIIHGNNGAGKTTLLNIYLVLYTKPIPTTSIDKLVNKPITEAQPGQPVDQKLHLNTTANANDSSGYVVHMVILT